MTTTPPTGDDPREEGVLPEGQSESINEVIERAKRDIDALTNDQREELRELLNGSPDVILVDSEVTEIDAAYGHSEVRDAMRSHIAELLGDSDPLLTPAEYIDNQLEQIKGKYLSLGTVAGFLGIPPDEVIRLREKGELRGFADRGSWMFKKDDVKELHARLQVPGNHILDEEPPFTLGSDAMDSSHEIPTFPPPELAPVYHPEAKEPVSQYDHILTPDEIDALKRPTDENAGDSDDSEEIEEKFWESNEENESTGESFEEDGDHFEDEDDNTENGDEEQSDEELEFEEEDSAEGTTKTSPDTKHFKPSKRVPTKHEQWKRLCEKNIAARMVDENGRVIVGGAGGALVAANAAPLSSIAAGIALASPTANYLALPFFGAVGGVTADVIRLGKTYRNSVVYRKKELEKNLKETYSLLAASFDASQNVILNDGNIPALQKECSELFQEYGKKQEDLINEPSEQRLAVALQKLNVISPADIPVLFSDDDYAKVVFHRVVQAIYECKTDDVFISRSLGDDVAAEIKQIQDDLVSNDQSKRYKRRLDMLQVSVALGRLVHNFHRKKSKLSQGIGLGAAGAVALATGTLVPALTVAAYEGGKYGIRWLRDQKSHLKISDEGKLVNNIDGSDQLYDTIVAKERHIFNVDMVDEYQTKDALTTDAAKHWYAVISTIHLPPLGKTKTPKDFANAASGHVLARLRSEKKFKTSTGDDKLKEAKADWDKANDVVIKCEEDLQRATETLNKKKARLKKMNAKTAEKDRSPEFNMQISDLEEEIEALVTEIPLLNKRLERANNKANDAKDKHNDLKSPATSNETLSATDIMSSNDILRAFCVNMNERYTSRTGKKLKSKDEKPTGNWEKVLGKLAEIDLLKSTKNVAVGATAATLSGGGLGLAAYYGLSSFVPFLSSINPLWAAGGSAAWFLTTYIKNKFTKG